MCRKNLKITQIYYFENLLNRLFYLSFDQIFNEPKFIRKKMIDFVKAI